MWKGKATKLLHKPTSVNYSGTLPTPYKLLNTKSLQDLVPVQELLSELLLQSTQRLRSLLKQGSFALENPSLLTQLIPLRTELVISSLPTPPIPGPQQQIRMSLVKVTKELDSLPSRKHSQTFPIRFKRLPTP